MMEQSKLPFEAERSPIVFTKNGEVFANSRDIAAYFGKEHRSVLVSVDNLIQQEPNLGLHNFMQTPYVEPSNSQKYRSFDMDRDGFTLLAMGFTGSKALKWKMRYIEAFNAMEAELRRHGPGRHVDLNDPSWLRGQLLSYTEQVILLRDEVAAQKPKVEALERIAEAEGSLCVTDAAKTLQVPPNRLFKWLDGNGWTYVRPGTSLRLAYQSKIQSGHMEHKITTRPRDDGSERAFTQARITAKGLAILAEVFPRAAKSV